MSDFDELTELITSQMKTGQRFRLQFEPVVGTDRWDIVLIATGAHCATCQCIRTDPATLPKDPDGHPRRCHWHHD